MLFYSACCLGPDHLAAILPASVGLNGIYGMKVGAIWGLGHGFSATLLGVSAFLVKGQVSQRFKFLETMSSWAENAVGISLIAIGALGLKENLLDQPDEDTEVSSKPRNFQAIFANGVLHGFSWDGAPSLAPTLAIKSWTGILGFLLSYCIGTMLMMSIASGFLSEASRRLGNAMKDKSEYNFPKQLSIGSSILAILLGIFWIIRPILF